MNSFLNPPAIVRPADELAELASKINQAHEAGTQHSRRSLEHFRAAGEWLAKAKNALPHGEWLRWLKTNVKFSERRVQRYLALAKNDVTSDLEEQEAAWRQICGNESAEAPEPEAEQNPPRVTYNSGENEWYTPADIIERARAALGGIDLDPASSEIAQQTVQATRYYTKETNGLAQPWAGRVWMNPPYDRSIGQFIDKLLSSPVVSEALVLTNNATETEWFQKLAARSACLCLLSSRVAFLDVDGTPGSPTQGQVLFYVGGNREKFQTAFEGQGLFVGGL